MVPAEALALPKAETFDSPLGAGEELKAPKADGPWLAYAPNPVAGFKRPALPLPKPVEPNVEGGLLESLGVEAKEPNRPPPPKLDLGLSVSDTPDVPPRERPPSPASVSTSADMGSSELDMDMAMGDAREVPCETAGGANVLTPKPAWPNFEVPAEANPPNPPELGAVVPNGALLELEGCPKLVEPKVEVGWLNADV